MLWLLAERNYLDYFIIYNKWNIFLFFAEENYDAFCLAYMFTYRDFEGGTLGLAWTGDMKNAGGVCERNGVSFIHTVFNFMWMLKKHTSFKTHQKKLNSNYRKYHGFLHLTWFLLEKHVSCHLKPGSRNHFFRLWHLMKIIGS